MKNLIVIIIVVFTLMNVNAQGKIKVKVKVMDSTSTTAVNSKIQLPANISENLSSLYNWLGDGEYTITFVEYKTIIPFLIKKVNRTVTISNRVSISNNNNAKSYVYGRLHTENVINNKNRSNYLLYTKKATH